MPDILTADCRLEPYWWRAAPRERAEPPPLPQRTDVAIVGSGITGLVAAIHLTRAGRDVTVIDSGAPGQGASSRNAGYVGRTLKQTFGELMDSHGLDFATKAYRELHDAFRAVGETVEREKIGCHFRHQGRLLLATSPGMREQMLREFALREKHLSESFEPVDRSEQQREIETPLYHGGVRIADHAGLHPGLYHSGLLARAAAAGARVAALTAVTSVAAEDGGFRVATDRGGIVARDVILATNGYSGAAAPWLQRRVIPFDAYAAVTESLDPALVSRLLAGDRTYIDWNFNVDFFRRAPGDDSRILFGGLTGERTGDLARFARRLHARMVRIFPALREARFDNVWTGRCAGTFDFFPHIGRHEGMHYGVGYCFAGVPMGTLFGRKLAARVLGTPDGDSVFDWPLPASLFYRGNPWFVPWAIRWMSRHDR